MKNITDKTDMQINKDKVFIALLLMIIIITSIIFITSAIIETATNPESWRLPRIYYFTIQSNIIVTIWMIALIINIISSNIKCRYAINLNLSASITTYILVTGIVYWMVLVPIYYEPGADWLFTTSNLWLHAIMPLMGAVLHYYVSSIQDVNVVKLKLFSFYAYPLIYIIFAIINAIKGKYIYPMFNPNLLGGWLGVGVVIVVMSILCSLLYMLVLYGVRGLFNRKSNLAKDTISS